MCYFLINLFREQFNSIKSAANPGARVRTPKTTVVDVVALMCGSRAPSHKFAPHAHARGDLFQTHTHAREITHPYQIAFCHRRAHVIACRTQPPPPPPHKYQSDCIARHTSHASEHALANTRAEKQQPLHDDDDNVARNSTAASSTLRVGRGPHQR